MTICDKCKKESATKEIVFSYGIGMFVSYVYCNNCYELKLQQIHPSRITQKEGYLKVDCTDLYPGAGGGYETEQ